MAHEKREPGDENQQEFEAANRAEDQNLSDSEQEDAAALAVPGETDRGQEPDDLKVAGPTIAASLFPETGAWEIAAKLGLPSPPPDAPLLPEAAVADFSALGAVPEQSGESSVVLLPGEFGGESSAHDFVERVPGDGQRAIELPLMRRPETASPSEPFAGNREGASGGLARILGSPAGGEIRVAKRLMIEVEVTVVNAQRVSQIATHNAMDAFKQLADASVYKVAHDFRTFRESYRQAWDWKHI